MIVTLGVKYVASGGGSCYPGETINVPDDVGERLVRRHEATVPSRPKDEVKRVTKPVSSPDGLRGFAKLAWFRNKIKELGGEPQGRTLNELAVELKNLGG